MDRKFHTRNKELDTGSSRMTRDTNDGKGNNQGKSAVEDSESAPVIFLSVSTLRLMMFVKLETAPSVRR